MTSTHEIRPDLDEGIDRKVLAQLRSRFLTLNAGRMARAVEGLTPRQQSVLALLPLFFHVNHPLLPGYVSGSTPAGLANFEPEAQVLAEAQRLTRSFSYKPRHGNPPTPIHGLFLMGSLGTLAQADQSDMDVWVCHADDLNEAELGELRKKCQLLEAWAVSMGAEAHFFLVEPNRFAQGGRDTQLSSDDCGTSQHYLLLDEFYRTAIWLAGRTPIWWLVPVYEEARYAEFTHTLISKRFIRADETLDLGHLAHIPPGEFIGAGLWQLFKGIESPYKSVLKLLLTEVYASEHPKVQCLSLRFKRAVFANQLDLDELDPYVVVYRRIEEYLRGRNEPERLELVRRSLYLKVSRKLTTGQRTIGWQRALLERLANEWGWDQRQLALLDSRSQWKVRQVASERRALVNELNYSYRFLTQFARTEQTVSLINKRDLNVLGRRLYAAFERKAGKVEFINPGIAPDLAEDTLTLVHSPNRKEPGQFHWGLYNGSLTALEWEHFAPIKRSRDLLEMLTWCHRNGVIDSSTRLALHPGSSDLSEFELFNLLGSLQQTIALPLATVDEEHLLRTAIPDEVLLLINVGVDPLKHHRDLNILMTTERTDSLSYAGVRENLVLTLDQVTLNSWNEVMVSRYDGPHALLDCLRDYLNQLPRNQLPRLRVRCFCHNRAQFIAQRVEEIFDTAQNLQLSQLNHRYLIQVQQHYHVMELAPGQANHVSLPSQQALVDYLSEELASYSPLHLDAMALEDHDLAALLPMGLPECVQVFYRINEGFAELYVLDEFNALWQQRLPFHDEQSLLAPLQRFLQSIIYRRDALSPLDPQQPSGALQVLYYQLLPSAGGRARRVEPRPAPQTPANKPFYDVQAIIGKGSPGQVGITLYCNQREFSELEFGDQLFAVVAQEIVGQRRETERYRCYITDLDLSGLLGDVQSPSNLYLRYKAELEQALNQALNQI
ncbi:class I adenylate cyclase [Pseudomonas proteolytica]|uniref:Class I adenylate cyclase n=1 Tax=Pseudomonas proteolytica TaxID=219574 RepID=A0AAW5AH22_9PSED|nr:class I adenylate cyclase [Pseudomonas proteolytica]TDR44686.1 adenylate cyclase [Pseudomonas brenneri]KAA8699301.1 class I adenylate cyclase [Pseudomonas proteolytica]MCF5060448.1 class I adenylate cyclase [Pseudomonas proteolytica]MCF5104583.1 class I adenylate cyclase [Pseudomonas proteolytica]TWR77631.1 class I adenylate cyclase [Pseudomonas proteolytica]